MNTSHYPLTHPARPRVRSTRATIKRALRLALHALALCAALTSAQAARAQTELQTATIAYRQLVDDAVHAYNARQYEHARGLFERAHRLWPNARTLRGLGKVSFELARYRDAIDYLRRARTSGVQPLDRGMRKDAEQLELRARGYLTRVGIQIEPKTAELRIDGVAEPVNTDTPLRLDPGVHTVEVQAPGYAPLRRVYTLAAAEQTTWTLRLQSASAARTLEPGRLTLKEPADPLDPRPREQQNAQVDAPAPGWLLPTGLSLAFVGAAGAGISIGLLAAYLDHGDKLRQPGHFTLHYQERWLQARDRTLVVAGVSSGLLTLGAAALAQTVPRATRRWLTPTLLVAGVAVLATGIALYAGNSCGDPRQQGSRSCTQSIERRDGGSLLMMLSVPIFTMPSVYGLEALFDAL